MQEKRLPPSAKRLRDARKRGDVVFSADVASSLMFVVLLAFLWGLSGSAIELLWGLWQQSTGVEMFKHPDEQWGQALQHAAAVLLAVCASVCAVAAAAAALGSFMQVGGLAAWGRLAPDAKRLNPGQGLERLFSMRNVVNLGKLLLKTVLLGGLLWSVILGHLGSALRLGYLTPAGQMAAIGQVLLTTLAWAAVVYAVMAVADYAHQRFEFMKQHRMSPDELRREHQDSEGNQLNQSRRRATHFEAVYASVADRVRAATLVVHSRTVALALQYVSADQPPRVVAVGLGGVAEQICRLAREQMLYVELNPSLADQLQRDVALDMVAPQGLADVLLKLLRRAQSLES